MKLGRCPVCHSHLYLEALCQDEAGRLLLACVSKLESRLGIALVQYLGLFRPAKSDLSNARALRLAEEVLALQASPEALAAALQQTVEAIKAKRLGAAEAKPLANHNYLSQVLASVADRMPKPVQPVSKHTDLVVPGANLSKAENERLRREQFARMGITLPDSPGGGHG